MAFMISDKVVDVGVAQDVRRRTADLPASMRAPARNPQLALRHACAAGTIPNSTELAGP